MNENGHDFEDGAAYWLGSRHWIRHLMFYTAYS